MDDGMLGWKDEDPDWKTEETKAIIHVLRVLAGMGAMLTMLAVVWSIVGIIWVVTN